MAPPVPKPARRRNRKRKRRAASSDSSSSSDDSSSDESTQTKPQIRAPPAKKPGSDMTSSSESVSSDSDSESDDDDNARTTSMVKNQIQVDNPKAPHDKGASRRGSLSPPPPSAEIPSFLPSNPPADDTAVEQAMKDKFRKFWMSSIAEGFKEDLEEIRKEPNLGPSRLALLIDSLAAGADVFTSSASYIGTEINEVDVVMGNK